MPSTFCTGCNDQKRSKDSKYYSTDSLSLVAVNNLRQKVLALRAIALIWKGPTLITNLLTPLYKKETIKT